MKKIGNCEQSIDISRFKIIETQFDRILAKAKQRPLTNFRQSFTQFQIQRPDFRWTDGRSHFCVDWAIFIVHWCGGSYLWSWVGYPVIHLASHLACGSPVVYKVDSAGSLQIQSAFIATHCWGWFASQHWFTSSLWDVWGQNSDVSLANTSDVERWQSAENAG